MANRSFSSNALVLDKKVVTLWARANIGAAGAPTLQKFDHTAGAYVAAPASGNDGVKSIIRNSAGNYALLLQDSYVGLLAAWAGFAQDAAPAAGTTHIMATGTSVRAVAAPSVVIQCRNNAGAATDPGVGEVLIVEIELTDSTAA